MSTFQPISYEQPCFHHVQASRAAAYVLDTNVHFDKRKYTKGNSAGARTLISTFSCRSTCTLVFFFFFLIGRGGGGGGGRGQSRTQTYIFTAAGGLHHHYVKSGSGKVLYTNRKAV